MKVATRSKRRSLRTIRTPPISTSGRSGRLPPTHQVAGWSSRNAGEHDAEGGRIEQVLAADREDEFRRHRPYRGEDEDRRSRSVSVDATGSRMSTRMRRGDVDRLAVRRHLEDPREDPVGDPARPRGSAASRRRERPGRAAGRRANDEDDRRREQRRQVIEHQPVHGDVVEKPVDEPDHGAHSSPRSRWSAWRGRPVDDVAFEAGRLLDEGDARPRPSRRRRWRSGRPRARPRPITVRLTMSSIELAGRVRVVDVLAANVGAGGRDAASARIDDLDDLVGVERVADADAPFVRRRRFCRTTGCRRRHR